MCWPNAMRRIEAPQKPILCPVSSFSASPPSLPCYGRCAILAKGEPPSEQSLLSRPATHPGEARCVASCRPRLLLKASSRDIILKIRRCPSRGRRRGERGTFYQRRFFAKALLEPDLKYRSSCRALASDPTA